MINNFYFTGTKKPAKKLLKPLEKSFVKKDTLQPFEKSPSETGEKLFNLILVYM